MYVCTYTLTKEYPIGRVRPRALLVELCIRLNVSRFVNKTDFSRYFFRKITMFVLAELKSTVKVHPSLFSKSLAEVTKFELNKKLANKVLHKGLKFCGENI